MSKISIDTKQFAKELGFVCKLISGSLNPLWGNVLVEAEGETLRLTGTNGMSVVSTFITLQNGTKEPFAAAVAAKKMNDIVKLLEQDTVNLSKTDARLTLTAGKGKYIFGNSPEAVGSIQAFKGMKTDGETITVDANKLTELVKIGNTFAATEEKTKFSLMGVKLFCTPETIMVMAMDGQRAVDVMADDVQESRTAQVFIPREGSVVLADIVDSDKVNITVGNNLTFECGNRVATVRRSSLENMPDISMFLNKYLEKEEVVCTVESSVLTGAVKRLQTAVDGKLRKIVFSVTETGLTLTSNDPLGACQEFEEEVVATTVGTGKFGLNAGYVLDFSKLVSGLLTIRYNPSQPNAAAVLTNNKGFRCMISVVK